MSAEPNLKITPEDVLAIIGFDAQRIVTAISMGAIAVNPEWIQSVIGHMTSMNAFLLDAVKEQNRTAEMSASSNMKVELT